MKPKQHPTWMWTCWTRTTPLIPDIISMNHTLSYHMDLSALRKAPRNRTLNTGQTAQNIGPLVKAATEMQPFWSLWLRQGIPWKSIMEPIYQYNSTIRAHFEQVRLQSAPSLSGQSVHVCELTSLSHTSH